MTGTCSSRSKRDSLIRVVIFCALIALLILLTPAASGQNRKSYPVPVKIGQDAEGNEKYMTFKDLEQLKDIANGWIYALLGLGLKLGFDLFMKWRDRTSENVEEISKKMDEISNLIAKIDVRLGHIENTSVSSTDVSGIVEKEIDKYDKWKAHKRP